MSAELVTEIAIEREQLRRLLSTFAPLIERSLSSPPNSVEIAALATVLHSFYGGLENVFKRICVSIDSGLPEGGASHSALLDQVALATPKRPAVVSPRTAELLRDYMAFRHVFRHAYSFDLNWAKMQPLVSGIGALSIRIDEELNAFVEFLSRGA